jgi:hypothetical protein
MVALAGYSRVLSRCVTRADGSWPASTSRDVAGVSRPDSDQTFILEKGTHAGKEGSRANGLLLPTRYGTRFSYVRLGTSG